MADLYTPVQHEDGELWNAEDANRLETGIEALDVAVDALDDAVVALQNAGGSGGNNGQVLSGPRANFAPAIGTILLDTSLTPARYIGGYGNEWRELNGTAITVPGGGNPEPGTGTAPTNFTAVAGPGHIIGVINLSWNPVAGATNYRIYEIESPGGVANVTPPTTTSTRNVSTARNYEYWVTATVNGVESAASNHATATLPYVAPGGGGGGGTPSTDPSTMLNINGKGNGTGGWWNLGLGLSSGHTDITPSQLQNNYVNSPYYVANSTSTAVQFQVFMNGGRTSANTKYPRSELREYATGSTSTKAAWNGASGTHVLRYKARVMHYAPEKCEVVVGQIHDGSDDTLQIRAEAGSATGAQTWRLSVNGTEVDDLISGVALGQEVEVEIRLSSGTLTVKINGTTQHTSNPGYGSGQYFKIGAYPQQNSTDQSNASTEYSRVEIRDLFVSHS
jgi:hypothetical protein